MKKRFVLLLMGVVLAAGGCGFDTDGAGKLSPSELVDRILGSRDSGSGDTADSEQENSVSSFFAEDPAADIDLSAGDEYHYYYDFLSEEDQAIYRAVYQLMDERPSEVELPSTDTDHVSDIISLVRLDNPQFYYVDYCQYTTTMIAGQTLSVTLSSIYNMSEEEIAAADVHLSAWAYELKQQASSCGSKWDQAVLACRYLCEHLEYNENAAHNQDLYSVVLGSTVCQGYAYGYKYLCDQLDIPCAVVTGTAEDGVAHAWNLVQLDGIWCYVDCTYADSPCLDEEINYGWFGFGDDLMANRRSDQSAYLPVCNDLSASWYAHQNRSFSTWSKADIAALIQKENVFSFRYTNETAYEQAKTALFSDGDLADLIGNRSYHLSYVTADGCRCIFIRILFD